MDGETHMACLLGVPQFLGLCGVRGGRPLRRLGFRVWGLGFREGGSGREALSPFSLEIIS